MSLEKCPFCDKTLPSEFWGAVMHMQKKHLRLLKIMFEAMPDEKADV